MDTPHKSRTVLWDVLIFAAMLLFGAYGIFLRKNPHIEAITFVFFFQVVGALVFLVFHGFEGFPKPGAKEWRLLTALAVAAIGNDLAYFTAFQLTTIANAAIAHQMVSVILLFLAPIFLKEKTNRNEWMAMLVALVGVIILYSERSTGGGAMPILGITLGLISAIFLGFLIVLYRTLQSRGLSITTVNTWRYGLSVIILTPVMLLSPRFNYNLMSVFEPSDLSTLIVFGLLFAVLASGMHTVAISRARALHSSVIGKSEPVIAALYAYWLLGEAPSTTTLVGGALIIGASLWLAFGSIQKHED